MPFSTVNRPYPRHVSAVEECFSEPEPNVIESTVGFSVKVLGRVGMLYVEGPRYVRINSEVLDLPKAIVMSKPSIQLWEGTQPLPVEEQDQERIADNIKRALEACGWEVDLRGPFDWTSVAMRLPSDRRH